MPTSDPHQLSKIIDAVLRTRPKSVLDVGVGFGKYGVLLREYLEFWVAGEDYHNWSHRIDGIEVFEQYLTPLHAFVYNKIYVGDAAKILPTLTVSYDLLLLIDVIEHFTKEDGLHFLDLCFKRARNVLIATPRDIGVQADAFGNPHETHRSQWIADDFRTYQNCEQIDDGSSLAFYIGEDVAKVRIGSLERFSRQWPVVRRLLDKIKRFMSPILRPVWRRLRVKGTV